MSLPSKKTTFAFNHADQVRDYGKDVVDYSTLQAEFDSRAGEVLTYLNDIYDALVSVTDGSSGANQIGATAISDLDGAEVQSLIESLRNKLKATTDSSSGADFINVTAISGLTGTTVQSLLESVKDAIDVLTSDLNTEEVALVTHKSSSDHDGRYYTETEIDIQDAQNVKKTGVQTVADVKTFSSSPIVPTPTTDYQSSTKKYVDDREVVLQNQIDGNDTDISDLQTADEQNVKKTGNQTVAGTKTFSSNIVVPTTPTLDTHATSKEYVDSQAPLTIPNGSITDLKLSDAEGQIKDKVDSLLTDSYSPITQSFENVQSVPAETLDSPVLYQSKGLSLVQSVENATVETSVTSDDSNTLIKIDSDGEWLFNSSFTTSAQVYEIISGKKYFVYYKAKEESVGDLKDTIFVQTLTESQNFGNGLSGNKEVYHIFEASITGESNIGIREGNIGLVEKESQWLVDMASLGLSTILTTAGYTTDEQQKEAMLNIVRNADAGDTDIQSAVNNYVSVGQNLFNRLDYTNVDYAYKMRIDTSTQYTWSESVAYKLYDLQDNEVASGTALTVTGGTTAHQIAFANTITDEETFMLIKGSVVPTDYQPFKTNTLSADITLRSVPSAQDEVRNAVVDPSDSTKLSPLDKPEKIQRISDGVAVVGVVAVNTTNYPLAKDTGSFINMITAGGYEVGTIGTDSTSASGTLYYELATPVITQLTLDELWAFENGTIYNNSIGQFDYSTSQNKSAILTRLNETTERLDEKVKHTEGGTATTSATVTFETAYAIAPAIFPSDVTSITTTGFTMNASGGDWIATEK